MTKLVIENCNINEKYVAFWNSIFSNFYPCTFTHMGVVFSSSEHAFMWRKAMFFKDYPAADAILLAKSCKQAKIIGRSVKNFNEQDWSSVSFSIMQEVLFDKFNQNDSLKVKLLSVGDREFVEGSPYDKVWGVGIHWTNSSVFNPNEWQGKNLLGKALDLVKQKLITQS